MPERLIRLVCAIAVAVNALIPAVYMQARARGKNGVTVVICTCSGPQTVLIDSSGQQAPDKQKTGNKRDDCATSGALPLKRGSPPCRAAGVHFSAFVYHIEHQAFQSTPKSGAVS